MIGRKPTIFFFLIVASIIAAGCGGVTAEAFEGTPIPSLIPATLPAERVQEAETGGQCRIRAVDFIGAWVDAGLPEVESFDFIALEGQTCQASFREDLLKIFSEPNLWFDGAPACVSCHNANIESASAGMDLSSYEGILAGSRRATQEETGNDVLGGGNWTESIMYQQLIDRQMPLGRPPNSPAKGPVVNVGAQ